MKLLQGLSGHQHMIHFYDAFEDDHNVYIVMEYIVADMLGWGRLGQLAKCWVAKLQHLVAVKIIKNQPAYYQQALVEVSILKTSNKKLDSGDRHHIVRIYEYLVHQRLLCIASELLDTNF